MSINAIYNQALEGGNESDGVIISSKQRKTKQAHPCASKKKIRTTIQPQVELEPRSCMQEAFVVDNVEPIHFGDHTQMDQYDGEVQMVSNNMAIVTIAPFTEGTKKETIVHVGNPQQYFTMCRTTKRLNFMPTWDLKTCY